MSYESLINLFDDLLVIELGIRSFRPSPVDGDSHKSIIAARNWSSFVFWQEVSEGTSLVIQGFDFAVGHRLFELFDAFRGGSRPKEGNFPQAWAFR